MTDAKNNFYYLIPFCLIPFKAHADAGIPTLALAWPAFWLLLIPIVLVEAYVGVIKFKLLWKQALKIMILANLFSTLIGIPLAYLMTVLTQLSLLSPALLISLLKPGSTIQIMNFFPGNLVNSTGFLTMIGGDMPLWAAYAGALLMCIPYGFISYYLEKRIIQKKLSTPHKLIAHSWALYANITSYTVIIIILTFMWILSSINH
ncbi:hypothetical protein K1X76_09345 [bacterium]|nr:hypothetical protein [bacterium]